MSKSREEAVPEEVEPESSGWDVMDAFLAAVRGISAELGPDEAFANIIQETCNLLQCDRSTLFFVDADANELVLIVAKDCSNIRIPIGQGLSGFVAETGASLNVTDAYRDSRFNSAFDQATGYRTRSVLAVPVHDVGGDIVAVLQCINKLTAPSFSRTDEKLLGHLAAHVGVVLRNCRLFESERAARAQVSQVLNVVKALHANSGASSLIFNLTTLTPSLVGADRCTLYLLDQSKEQLVVMQGDLDFRFPVTKGLAGAVARSGTPLLIADAYDDDRFNQAMDKQSGYRTKAVLCVPIFERPDSIVGVLQLINKEDEDEAEFTMEDLDIITSLLAIAGPILHNAMKSGFLMPKTSYSDKESVLPVAHASARHDSVKSTLPNFREEDDEGD